MQTLLAACSLWGTPLQIFGHYTPGEAPNYGPVMSLFDYLIGCPTSKLLPMPLQASWCFLLIRYKININFITVLIIIISCPCPTVFFFLEIAPLGMPLADNVYNIHVKSICIHLAIGSKINDEVHAAAHIVSISEVWTYFTNGTYS